MTSGVVFFGRGDFAKRGSQGLAWCSPEEHPGKINILNPKNMEVWNMMMFRTSIVG